MPFELMHYLAFSVCVFIIYGCIVIGSNILMQPMQSGGVIWGGCFVNKNSHDGHRIIRHDTIEPGFTFH